jgi:hypothetical protein
MQVGRLVKELPRKAEVVGEAAYWGVIAEGIRVPPPHHRDAGIGDLVRRAKMIRRDIKPPRPLQRTRYISRNPFRLAWPCLPMIK